MTEEDIRTENAEASPADTTPEVESTTPRDERTRVLRMVAEGVISPEEGAELLRAMEPGGRREPPRSTQWEPIPPLPPMPPLPQPVAGRSRSLIIHIEDGDDEVNLRIPLGLARAANRFIPRQAQNRMTEYGIDIEQLLNEIGSTTVEGTLVQIESGDSEVRIAVE
jgi:hypothetical protein